MSQQSDCTTATGHWRLAGRSALECVAGSTATMLNRRVTVWSEKPPPWKLGLPGHELLPPFPAVRGKRAAQNGWG